MSEATKVIKSVKDLTEVVKDYPAITNWQGTVHITPTSGKLSTGPIADPSMSITSTLDDKTGKFLTELSEGYVNVVCGGGGDPAELSTDADALIRLNTFLCQSLSICKLFPTTTRAKSHIAPAYTLGKATDFTATLANDAGELVVSIAKNNLVFELLAQYMPEINRDARLNEVLESQYDSPEMPASDAERELTQEVAKNVKLVERGVTLSIENDNMKASLQAASEANQKHQESVAELTNRLDQSAEINADLQEKLIQLRDKMDSKVERNVPTESGDAITSMNLMLEDFLSNQVVRDQRLEDFEPQGAYTGPLTGEREALEDSGIFSPEEDEVTQEFTTENAVAMPVGLCATGSVVVSVPLYPEGISDEKEVTYLVFNGAQCEASVLDEEVSDVDIQTSDLSTPEALALILESAKRFGTNSIQWNPGEHFTLFIEDTEFNQVYEVQKIGGKNSSKTKPRQSRDRRMVLTLLKAMSIPFVIENQIVDPDTTVDSLVDMVKQIDIRLKHQAALVIRQQTITSIVGSLQDTNLNVKYVMRGDTVDVIKGDVKENHAISLKDFLLQYSKVDSETGEMAAESLVGIWNDSIQSQRITTPEYTCHPNNLYARVTGKGDSEYVTFMDLIKASMLSRVAALSEIEDEVSMFSEVTEMDFSVNEAELSALVKKTKKALEAMESPES